jgi:uncharacterized protein Usg
MSRRVTKHSRRRGLEGTMVSKETAVARGGRVSEDFRRQLDGYGLTTAQIFYRFPDHPALLQFYVWQEYDLFPTFPELKRFLDFWTQSLEGTVHSVIVAHERLLRPAEIRSVDGVFKVH